MNMHTTIAAAGTLLNINNYHYRRGGAETVYFDHMALFEGIGWDVVAFSMQHEKNLPSEWSDYFVSEIEYGRDIGFADKLSQASKVIYSFEARDKLRRLIERTRPSIAHAHNIYHHISPAIFPLLKDAGIPVVMTAHDLKLACPAYGMMREGRICEQCKGGRIHNVLVNRCIKGSLPLSAVILAETALHRALGLYRNHVDRIVVPSRFYRNKLMEWGWSPEKLVHIPNFVDAERFTPLEDEGDYFIFAGRLSREKGIATLIRAAAIAGQKLVIAGTGPDGDALRALATSLGVDAEFAGYRSGKELFDLIGRAKALVLPSEGYENAPISILEAYALARPVIGSRIGGIPEMVRSGETGLLAESGSPEAFAAALSDIAGRSSAERTAMGRAGREWVLSDFSRQAYLDRTLDLYRSLLGQPAVTRIG